MLVISLRLCECVRACVWCGYVCMHVAYVCVLLCHMYSAACMWMYVNMCVRVCVFGRDAFGMYMCEFVTV